MIALATKFCFLISRTRGTQVAVSLGDNEITSAFRAWLPLKIGQRLTNLHC